MNKKSKLFLKFCKFVAKESKLHDLRIQVIPKPLGMYETELEPGFLCCADWREGDKWKEYFVYIEI